MTREQVLKIAENEDDRLVISKIIDTVLETDKKNCISHTQFLDGHQVILAKKVLAQFNVAHTFAGGYDESERQILLCYPDYITLEDQDVPICIIKAQTKNKTRLSHRDYMGAVLNLGIKREKIGDIIVCDDCGYIVCIRDIADYIVMQIQKIGNSGVILSVDSFENVAVPKKEFKEVTTSCSSIRLDSVVSAGFGLSRADASSLISKGLVKVNWEVKDKNDFRPNEGDVLSVQGYGRMLFYKIGGSSKKGRIFITLRRYI